MHTSCSVDLWTYEEEGKKGKIAEKRKFLYPVSTFTFCKISGNKEAEKHYKYSSSLNGTHI